MKKNNYKTIVKLFLIIFFFGLLIPSLTQAANRWYYISFSYSGKGIVYPDYTTNNIIGANSQQECENNRVNIAFSNKSLPNDLFKNTSYTDCFGYQSADYSQGGRDSVLNFYNQNQSNIKKTPLSDIVNADHWWVIYQNSEYGNIVVEGPFPTDEACQQKLQSLLNGKFANSSYQSICQKSATQPATPTTVKNDPTSKINTDTTYTPLASLPGLEKFDTDPAKNPCPFGKYLNIMIKLIIGFGAVLAMVMIVVGGIEYMTSELISSKESGKETITNAILGLLIALGAYLILNTINPQLLSVCLDKLPEAKITISPEQQKIVDNRRGLGKCEVITNSNSPCFPEKLKDYGFTGTTNNTTPFNTKAAQASAICQLESSATPNMPVGKSPNSYLDKCSDNKPFSFGLFQINAAAHMKNIPACIGAFDVPSGSQGSCLEKDEKSGYCAKWSCKTIEPAYTKCQNYLIDPINNAKYAATLQAKQGWSPWTTYNSCKNKF